MESSVLSTNLDGNNDSKEIKITRQRKSERKQLLERKKAAHELIKAASVEKDYLSYFPPFRHFSKNGLSACLESGSGDKLSTSLKRHLQKLLKENMERHYSRDEWAIEEKVKRREMVTSEARYIFVYNEASSSSSSSNNNNNEYYHEHNPSDNEVVHLDQCLVGFVHYRFTLEEELPVLYVYEIQLDSCVQGNGLGKFLMELVELVAHKSCMSAIVLTVQKANLVALHFYTSKLGYNISSISPSRVDTLMGVNKSYEILCKAFDSEAKAILEGSVLAEIKGQELLRQLRTASHDS